MQILSVNFQCIHCNARTSFLENQLIQLKIAFDIYKYRLSTLETAIQKQLPRGVL